MKTIYVPKNLESLKRFDFDQHTPKDVIQFDIAIDIFIRLFSSGFFNQINNLIDSIIDIYEDECIMDTDKLEKVINSGLLNDDQYDNTLASTVYEIKKLFIEAHNRKTGIHFYF